MQDSVLEEGDSKTTQSGWFGFIDGGKKLHGAVGLGA
jgi:hypothetical protein